LTDSKQSRIFGSSQIKNAPSFNQKQGKGITKFMKEQVSENDSLSPDEMNRLWQHALHEERLFHDRLNYFSVVEIGLLSAFAILYNKEHPFGLLASLTGAALIFTVFWLLLQYKHWTYCTYIYSRLRENVPEYRQTVDIYFGQDASNKSTTAFSFSKPLSLAAPVIFALTWAAFLGWIIMNP
jgi:hypothetical protein